jgi:hypothetical protein
MATDAIASVASGLGRRARDFVDVARSNPDVVQTMLAESRESTKSALFLTLGTIAAGGSAAAFNDESEKHG